jgi:hypothetical protein
VIDSKLLDRFARIALSHVEREYPNKLDHVINGASDVLCPKALHPVFYGSFDWHSCVHGYWTLATVLRLHPDGPHAGDIAALFERNLTPEKIGIEREYAMRTSSRGFERPYGWAWCLMLGAELRRHNAPWFERLSPLLDVFSQRWLDFLPLLAYPIRTGVHSNTAFAARLTLEYAREVRYQLLERALHEKLWEWHGKDRDAQAWEPSSDDFLSPALTVAQALAYAGPQTETATWLKMYLPRFAERSPVALFRPVVPSDRSDGKIAHLDGLNLSRAFALYELGRFFPESIDVADEHLSAALPHVEGDYMGEHWLASFALLASLAKSPPGHKYRYAR